MADDGCAGLDFLQDRGDAGMDGGKVFATRRRDGPRVVGPGIGFGAVDHGPRPPLPGAEIHLDQAPVVLDRHPITAGQGLRQGPAPQGWAGDDTDHRRGRGKRGHDLIGGARSDIQVHPPIADTGRNRWSGVAQEDHAQAPARTTSTATSPICAEAPRTSPV